jgi:CheY-like chemotaxis protein
MIATSAPVVVALETGLRSAWQIESAVRSAGARLVVVGDGESLLRAIDDWPELVIIDLTATNWEAPVRRVKSLPQTKRIPIIAFGSHEDAAALLAARAAGCDHVLTHARFVDEFPDLLQRALHPPTRWVEGWDAPPPRRLCKGVAQFNVGEYWECHETLEALWIAEPRPVRDLYQGVLQVGVAFHHLRDGNYPGTVKMLRRGLPRLRDLPENCQGLRVAELFQAARAVHDRVVGLGPERIGEIDADKLPHITLTGCTE